MVTAVSGFIEQVGSSYVWLKEFQTKLSSINRPHNFNYSFKLLAQALVSKPTYISLYVSICWLLSCSDGCTQTGIHFGYSRQVSQQAWWIVRLLMGDKIDWMKRRLSVTNFSLENSLLTFRLNAPVIIRVKVKEVRTNVTIYSHALVRIHVIGGQRSVWIVPPSSQQSRNQGKINWSWTLKLQ